MPVCIYTQHTQLASFRATEAEVARGLCHIAEAIQYTHYVKRRCVVGWLVGWLIHWLVGWVGGCRELHWAFAFGGGASFFALLCFALLADP
jgi:hypothetical protein